MGLPRRSFRALRLVPSTCRPGPVPTRGNLLRRAHAGSLFRLGPAVEIPIPPTHSSHRRYVAPRRSGSGLAVSTPVAPPPEEADAAEKREHWPGWCSVERNGERHSDDGEHERNCLAGSVLKHDRPVLLKPLASPAERTSRLTSSFVRTLHRLRLAHVIAPEQATVGMQSGSEDPLASRARRRGNAYFHGCYAPVPPRLYVVLRIWIDDARNVGRVALDPLPGVM